MPTKITSRLKVHQKVLPPDRLDTFMKAQIMSSKKSSYANLTIKLLIPTSVIHLPLLDCACLLLLGVVCCYWFYCAFLQTNLSIIAMKIHTRVKTRAKQRTKSMLETILKLQPLAFIYELNTLSSSESNWYSLSFDSSWLTELLMPEKLNLAKLRKLSRKQ